mmetsp:Transcript_29082/g.38241  ORF Transcript_29082/g.38241 Transcript_29082/m.38241 type:complete len:144 (+) Transcript_29082:93-524(+)
MASKIGNLTHHEITRMHPNSIDEPDTIKVDDVKRDIKQFDETKIRQQQAQQDADISFNLDINFVNEFEIMHHQHLDTLLKFKVSKNNIEATRKNTEPVKDVQNLHNLNPNNKLDENLECSKFHKYVQASEELYFAYPADILGF